MTAEKESLRAAMRARRLAEPEEARRRSSESVCGALASMDLKGPVAVYLAKGAELDRSPFIRTALKTSTRLLAPRWNGSAYELAPLNGLGAADVVPGPMGILEPVRAPRPEGVCEPRTWLVPGLAFTRDGRRLGYGGGWYDRMLAGARSDAVLIGVAYAFQVVEAIPCEPHDVALSTVVCDGEACHLL